MTNRVALSILGLLCLLGLVDGIAFGGANAFFLAKKFLDFVEYVAFWR